jgi:hypothetical protein
MTETIVRLRSNHNYAAYIYPIPHAVLWNADISVGKRKRKEIKMSKEIFGRYNACEYGTHIIMNKGSRECTGMCDKQIQRENKRDKESMQNKVKRVWSQSWWL